MGTTFDRRFKRLRPEETFSSYVQQLCVCDLSPTGKHGRPPNQQGSANKPPACGLSVVKLLVSCGASISKVKLSVLRTLNRLAGTVFNVAPRLFGLGDLLFLLHIITGAGSEPTSTGVHESSRVPLEKLLMVILIFGSVFTLV